MSALRIGEKATSVEALQFQLVGSEPSAIAPGQCVINVRSAAINMSDAKAALGQMPHAIWPRTPGRDYAGVVVEGPKELLAKEVWGSGGELGITRDGTHASYLVVDAESVRVKPSSVSMLEAGAVGVPFITAYEGLRRAGGLEGKKSILVCGANGRVGQAVVQLATAQGLQVFGVERTREDYRGHATGAIDMIDASTQSLGEYVRGETEGRGVDLVFNTVGSPYFVEAHASMAKRATQIFIATIDRAVPFDIFQFFRGQHTFVGIDTLALDTHDCAVIFDQITPLFESGVLKPFAIPHTSVFDLASASEAYRMVYLGSGERVVLRP